MRVLETKLKRTQLAWVAILSLAAFMLAVNLSPISSANQAKDTVLRVRGLIIEDESGNPRLLLGAPTPTVRGRKRSEPVNGIVVLGANGTDRIVISYPGIEPQVEGRIEKRSVAIPSAGFLINDAEGDERAGLGVSDDGSRISLGLDYADRDAMGLLVSPGFSGIVGFARAGERNDQFTLGVQKDGTATFKLADGNGDEGIIADVHKGAALKLQVANPATHKLEDVTKRLMP